MSAKDRKNAQVTREALLPSFRKDCITASDLNMQGKWNLDRMLIRTRLPERERLVEALI